MIRISLSRLSGDRVLVVDGDAECVFGVDELPAHVRTREAETPRWVWDDTARWYPALLAAGVRVGRCHDLRLGHQLLRLAPTVDGQLLEGEQPAQWDRLGPSLRSDPALFSLDDTAEHLRADLEDSRQLAAVAASPEAARLGLLLAAESAGALVAVEMTYAGVPWRVDVHERRASTPTHGPSCSRRFAGPAWSSPTRGPRPLRMLEHPGIDALLRYKQLAHLFQTNGWTWIDQWVSGGRFRPSYQPAGSTTGRWASNGGGALSFPVQVRPAGPTSTRGWSTTVQWPAARTPSSVCSAPCTAPPAVRAAGWSPGSPAATPTRSVSWRRRPVPVSGARWCARCWGAGRLAWAMGGLRPGRSDR